MSFELCENKAIGEKYYKTVHKSGLPIFVIPKKHSGAFAVFGTNFGSMDAVFKTDKDDDFITVPDGVAHFLEHKLFEDENGGDAFERYAKHGGSANAFTSQDKTCFLFSCTENFCENLKILLDFVTHPYFTDATVQKEQGIIGEEISMYEDNPGYVVYFNMLNAMYKANPLRIDIAGTRESIAKITPQILYRCCDTFYNLNNMALCVCGDIDPYQVEKIADECLTASESINISLKVPEEPTEIVNKRVVRILEVAQPMFDIGFKYKTDSNKEKAFREKAAAAILLQLLFGQSGDFYNRHYESGLLNDRFSYNFDQIRTEAYFEISGVSADPDAVLQAICDEIEIRKKNFFTKQEFETAKRVIYSESLFDYNSTDGIATSFIACFFSGCDMFDYPSLITDISYDEVRSLLESGMKTDRCVLSIVKNEK